MLFILFAVVQGNSDNLTITSLANFTDRAQCEAAKTTITGALGAVPNHTEILCAPATAFDRLEQASKQAATN